MFTCCYCQEIFNTQNQLNSHYSICKKHPENVKEKFCPFCNKSFYLKSAYNRHLNYCKNNPDRKVHKNPQDSVKHIKGVCQFCSKEYSTNTALKNHERYCPNNPDKQISPLKNQGWAKGLNRFTDERVARQSEGQKKYYQTHSGTGTNREWSQESKDKLIKYYNAYRGYFDGILFMSGWELVYYIYMKDHGHSIQRNKQWFSYTYEGVEHRYNPDFLVDNSIVVEVKGYETEIDKIKYSCVPNLQVIKDKDIAPMMAYVLQKFNTDNIKNVYERKINC